MDKHVLGSWSRRLPVAALVIVCLYLPTLAQPFDFSDDGCLAYPPARFSLAGFFPTVWQESAAEFRTHGPFRPVCRAHWDAAAELFGPRPFGRRLARLGWALLAVALMMRLLLDLGLHPGAVVLATALAMANRYRSELWLGFGITEGYATPYALGALVCAVRGARSRRPWKWDVGCVLGLVLAVGIKNTFAAVVPAAVILRVGAGTGSFAEGLRRHWRAGLLVAAVLVLPGVHFLLYLKNPRPVVYQTGFYPDQPLLMVRAVLGAMDIGFLSAGLVLAAVALWRDRRTGLGAARLTAPGDEGTLTGQPAGALRPDGVGAIPSRTYRLPLTAGATLLGCGLLIYLPVHGVAGRYTVPAVWGLDIALAVLLSVLIRTTAGTWKRAALAAFGIALLAAAVSNLGSQEKRRARLELLWQVVHFVERHGPPHGTLAWIGTGELAGMGAELALAEGEHFRWHLQARGSSGLRVQLVDCESPATPPSAGGGKDGGDVLAVRGVPSSPPDEGWRLVRRFTAPYWWGRRCFSCYLWGRKGGQR